jgi:hypothetical protein
MSVEKRDKLERERERDSFRTHIGVIAVSTSVMRMCVGDGGDGA